MNASELTFPNEPRSELDRALDELVTRAREVSASQETSRVELDRVMGELIGRARDVSLTQGRLRALLKANMAVVQQLDLPTVLQQIVDAAAELLDAQYAALGVIAPLGGLEQFIYVGMSPTDVEAIGHLPEGHGLLGALIDDPRPIRLDHLSDDRRSIGFPAHHPPMESFLGVPVRVRDEVYGNLYLSNRSTGAFTEEDEQLALALAGTAGFAIDNARLFEETQARQAWSMASAEMTSTLLSDEQEDTLPLFVSRVFGLANADFVLLFRPSADGAELVVSAAAGSIGRMAVGGRISRDETVAGSVLGSRQPLSLDAGDPRLLGSYTSDLTGPMMLVPVAAAGEFGVLVVGRSPKANPFTRSDLELLADFTQHAGVALELAAARTLRQRSILLEDRARIARDLHDHVIQQLFAAGLGLQSLVVAATDGDQRNKLVQSIDSIDAAIAQIRTAIFAISGTNGGDGAALRDKVIDIVDELKDQFDHTPSIRFVGPVDLVITNEFADDVIAVVREALTNVARHAHAHTVSVEVIVNATAVTVEVTDDGIGFPGSTHRSGLANLDRRASGYGGTFQASSASGSTRIAWSVPIEALGGDSR